MKGQIAAIYIAPQAEAPMESIGEARLEPGRGIVGDRYYLGTGTFSEQLKGLPDSEVTLVESEQVDSFNQETGMSLDYGTARRNIVTTGVDLNRLVGSRFKVGEAVLEGIRLCEPCAHLARLVAREVLPALVHRAGLRAKIVSGGIISAGDSVDFSE